MRWKRLLPMDEEAGRRRLALELGVMAHLAMSAVSTDSVLAEWVRVAPTRSSGLTL